MLFSDVLGHLRQEFGDVVKFKGILGKQDSIFLFKPEDFATMFRTEGTWPLRRGMEAFVYYRNNVGPMCLRALAVW
jgi:cytochrome P450 family 12